MINFIFSPGVDNYFLHFYSSLKACHASIHDQYFILGLDIGYFLQFSSLGSLDEKWMAEFASSVSAGVTSDKSPLGIGKPLIIWPTVEDVRCSLEVLQQMR